MKVMRRMKGERGGREGGECLKDEGYKLNERMKEDKNIKKKQSGGTNEGNMRNRRLKEWE